ncbi:peroxiredoxin [Anaplasmataceae bacterium AB001_6]|nr:peroxiredoxin [Anaplasmataceae bacterium AB001_6]
MLAKGSIDNFQLLSQKGENMDFADTAEKNSLIILYFYPKDNTPGCTTEAKDFNDNLDFFMENNVAVFGISPDSVSSHRTFADKYDLEFPLLSDHDKQLSRKLGVLQEKSMFGKKYMGIVRSTFLISNKMEIIKSWEKVKVRNHVQEIMKYIEELK